MLYNYISYPPSNLNTTDLHNFNFGQITHPSYYTSIN